MAGNVETMAAANFSEDVLELFYGPILQEDQRRLMLPMRPERGADFEIVRNDFNNWLRVWKMTVPRGNRDLLKFYQKTKKRFIDVCEYEVRTLKSVKIQFSFFVRFSWNRGEEVQRMEHYFNRIHPAILNEHNMDTLNHFVK